MAHSFRFLPDEKDHEATRLLPWVMAVMVYLSALSLTGGILVHKGFGGWTESLSNRLTIQISVEDAAEPRADGHDDPGDTGKNTGGHDSPAPERSGDCRPA